jgi:hypothetical protein
MNKLFILSLILLLPIQIENIMQIYQNSGNMGMYGLMLGIYYNRNFIWLTFGLFLISLLFNTLYGIKFFLMTLLGLFLIKYFVYIKKYEYIFNSIFN